MTGAGRPIKFLLLVLAGWTGARATLLWPGAELAAVAEASETPAGLSPMPAAPLFAFPQPSGHPRRVGAASPEPLPAGYTEPGGAPVFHAAAAMLLPISQAAPGGAPAPQVATSPEPALALVAQPRAPRRWSASAWLVARGGSMAGDGAFGPAQLGGSQAGARIRYALTRTLALSGRFSSPLRGVGKEAGLGVEWQPLKLPLPVSILLERRIALDSGPDGTGLGAIAGINPTPVFGRLQVEGYGQAGVVLRARREPYADGAVRVLHPVSSGKRLELALGAGAWGGAQRGASRLDIGPSLVATVPTGGPKLRLAAEWRQRVAGNAAPGSGPALTLGTDF
ncbi:hypothetical protein [Sphingomonas desiccabilis]|uniref:hypothetical protein n=1 Tax=Sphingomonas desiccabilis TaxID=429134 RepID=UPI0017C3AED0|nr:hypothetical protein [Sphingomonas desiccabilis]MBB3911688.1 hypothetical protein [Sphingomonas desiccabilis]